jgi:hypothetical protein
MRASIRIASSVRCASSLAVGWTTGSGASTGFGTACRRRRTVDPRHQLLRLDLERLDPLGGDGDLAADRFLQRGERCLRFPLGFGVAAAVEIGLREDVRFRRLGYRLRVDERHLERVRAVLQLAQIERMEANGEQHRMQHDRNAQRVGKEPARAGSDVRSGSGTTASATAISPRGGTL